MLYAAIAFFVLALSADAYTTARLLRRDGFREANPLMRAVLDRLGVVPGILLTRAALVAIVAGAAWSVQSRGYGEASVAITIAASGLPSALFGVLNARHL